MNPFVAEIRPFAFSFAPKGWAMCNGQLMPISQNTALFSLLGTYYGGDGKSTFALPNLMGRVPVHVGQGPGLQEWVLGEIQGVETITLTLSQIPLHTHTLTATSTAATTAQAGPSMQLANGFVGGLQESTSTQIYSASAPNQPIAAAALLQSGGSTAHNNMMPYLTVNYCIALQGNYPSRN